MDTLKTIAVITASTFLIWMSAAIVSITTYNTTIENAAAILAFLSTLSIVIIAGLNAIDERHNAALRNLNHPPSEKAKREAAPTQDARVELLLALLSDEERATLRDRLIDDLAGDGEVLSLADLLTVQETERHNHARY